tara:strand:- start:79 stop:267 length:189 start_codon:yes stop_codon:yes gene_type:complete
MSKQSAISYLDMDEVTFERFIHPLLTCLRFEGTQTFYLSEQVEDAVFKLIDLHTEKQLTIVE